MKTFELKQTREGIEKELRAEIARSEADPIRIKELREKLEQVQSRLDASEQLDAYEEPIARELTHEERHVSERYSLCKVLLASDPSFEGRAQLDLGYEREVQQELERRSGKRFEGFGVPQEIFRTPATAVERRALTTSTEAGDLIATQLRGDLYVDRLRDALILGQLGARTITGLVGDVDIPRSANSNAATFIDNETTNLPAAPTFDTDKISLTPHTLGSRYEITRKMLLQSTPDVEQLVRADLAAQIRNGVDSAGISGDGTGANPQGVIGSTGVIDSATAVTTASALRDQLIDDAAQIMSDNVVSGPQALGVAIPSIIWRETIKALVTGTAVNYWEMMQRDGFRFAISQSLPVDTVATPDEHDYVIGEWSNLIVGLWSGVDILANPYEASVYARGALSVRVLQDVDFVVRRGIAFRTGAYGVN